jgi:deoxyribonuclease V
MQYKNLHPWNVSPQEAIEIQKDLRKRIVISPQPSVFKNIKYIAGADISIRKGSSFGYGGVIIMTFPDMDVIEEEVVKDDIKFPYIPGLLAFREAPILLKAFEKLKNEPDLIIFDGQGIAHPRGLGIASHLGIILDKPTIGCAKSKLFGTYNEPGKNEGDFSYLYSPQDADNIIGAVVRTKSNTRPVFVSIGHKIDLQTSIKFILECRRGYRIPEPTRIAHNLVSKSIKILLKINRTK